MSEVLTETTLAREVERLGSERWPLLARALSDAQKANSTKIEWLLRPESGSYRAQYNYAEIFRDSDLESLIDRLEYTLRRGRRHIDYTDMRSSMAGVHELIGRWPGEDDTVRLRILRDLAKRSYDYPPTSEWILEVSLLAATQADGW